MRLRASNDLPVAGFTLIEMMITVAVIAILGAIALPNYFDYVKRSRLVEAKTGLADMRTRMEQFFLDYRKFPTCVRADQTATPGAQIRRPPDHDTDPNSKFFTFACAGDGITTYTVTATGQGSMAGFVFTIDQANVKTSAVPSGWTAPSPNTCWVSRKNGDC